MKLKKIYFGIFICLTLFSSIFIGCTDDNSVTPSFIEKKEEINSETEDSSFKISKEDALKELITTLEIIEDNNSRSLGKSMTRSRINQIERLDTKNILSVLKPRLNTTRSHDGTNEIMYLVNFENEGGYAVLSADTRIPETVLAIVDSGSISATDFEAVGLFMTEEERQQEIENFKYFDEEEQDYYVGRIEDHRYPTQYLLSYAMDRIDDYSGGGGGGYSSTYIRRGAWKIKEQVSAMLDTKWHQRSPFNDMCPERKKYLRLFGPKRKAPAGCVPIAVAQIMAYHEYPTHFTYNGIYVSWKDVKSIWSYNNLGKGNDAQNLMAAALLKGIGDWTNISYGYSGSMGLPRKAKKYLDFCGFRNVKKHSGKNQDKTMEMLRKQNPVFMAGAAGLGGHAWVIDGFRIKTRDIETVNSTTGNVISTTTEEETLLHCNWGWGGTADGYYAAGTFNTKRQASEYDIKDGTNHNTGNSHFGWLFSIITYDK